MEALSPLAEGREPRIKLDCRVRLAANPGTDPALLSELAADEAVVVRVAVALNPSIPLPARLQLATDLDERVRLLLTRKLASALPQLSDPEMAAKRDQVFEVLTALVRDEAVRIRTVVANAVASLSDVPREVVLALAGDSVVCVSEPVLRLSPLLSAEDLLALLAAPPHPQTATAIACRAFLSAEVADAIAASADDPAILNLLSNRSAALRESTLDNLVARAVHDPEWLSPLVNRPRLPDGAARALSEILTGQLLGELATRPDLPPAILDRIRQRLTMITAAMPKTGTDGEYLAAAHRLRLRGHLTETHLAASLQAGEVRRASALLAVAAGVPLGAVDRAVAVRNKKALISLIWKAGFSANLTGAVQAVMGRVAPDAVLPNLAPGEFPLRPDEMTWQLVLLGSDE